APKPSATVNARAAARKVRRCCMGSPSTGSGGQPLPPERWSNAYAIRKFVTSQPLKLATRAARAQSQCTCAICARETCGNPELTGAQSGRTEFDRERRHSPARIRERFEDREVIVSGQLDELHGSAR